MLPGLNTCTMRTFFPEPEIVTRIANEYRDIDDTNWPYAEITRLLRRILIWMMIKMMIESYLTLWKEFTSKFHIMKMTMK